MRDINEIKLAIAEMYENNTKIHVNVHMKKPKINVDNATATITGVYKNLFRIETVENGAVKSYTVQYTDLFIGGVSISELELKNK